MSAAMPPVAVIAAGADGPPGGTEDDELVPRHACCTSQSDSRGEKSQTRELLES